MNKVVVFIVCAVIACVQIQLNNSESASSHHCDVICDDEQSTSQVCASDGVTYASKCDYNNAACKASLNGTRLHMIYYGQCITLSTPCSKVLQSRCPSSFYSYGYVCGSDGRTYTTECSLAYARCHSLQNANAVEIELNHRGSCEHITNASRQVDCSQYVSMTTASIAIEGGAKPTLKLITCPRLGVYRPVCSLTSHSYSSECSFCHSLALSHKITPSNMTVYISHNGTCHHYSSPFG